MLTVVPFRPEHLKALRLQRAQEWLAPAMQVEGYGEAFVQAGPAYTAIADGRVVGCLGVAELWQGRCAAWALLAADIGSHFVAIHRAVQRFLDGCGFRRIEAYVDVGFGQAHRWAKMLGFKLETPEPMEAFAENRSMYLYARVQHG